MVTLLQSDAILELGKKIVFEIGKGESVNTLVAWMSHYIAELINQAEIADPKDKDAKLELCFEAILRLWNNRHSFPHSHRPLVDFEPILRALEGLDPDRDQNRYYGSILSDFDESEENPDTVNWFEIITNFDYTARTLIRFFLVKAAASSLDKSKEWVQLAEAAGVGDGVDFSAIRLAYAEHGLVSKPGPEEAKKIVLRERIERLTTTRNAITGIIDELQKTLDSKDVDSSGE